MFILLIYYKYFSLFVVFATGAAVVAKVFKTDSAFSLDEYRDEIEGMCMCACACMCVCACACTCVRVRVRVVVCLLCVCLISNLRSSHRDLVGQYNLILSSAGTPESANLFRAMIQSLLKMPNPPKYVFVCTF